jgi:hypothetical protein
MILAGTCANRISRFSAFSMQHTGILASFELERCAKQEKVFRPDAIACKN